MRDFFTGAVRVILERYPMPVLSVAVDGGHSIATIARVLLHLRGATYRVQAADPVSCTAWEEGDHGAAGEAEDGNLGAGGTLARGRRLTGVADAQVKKTRPWGGGPRGGLFFTFG